MTTPTHHRPHRGRTAVATVTAAVLLVVGLVLLATAGSNRSGDPAPAVAGAPRSVAPQSPNPPSVFPGAVAPAGGSVSGSSAPGAPANPVPGAAVPGPGAGSPAAPAPPGSPAQPGTPSSPGISASARRAAIAAAPTLPPQTLSIPSLGVGPSPLGSTPCAEPNGVLEPPVNSVGMLCAWRGSATLDSSSGQVSIAGHINYDGAQGAFANLARLSPGQTIYTSGPAGTQTWIVTREFARSKTLPLDAGAFLGLDGSRQLALISCGGPLIPGQRSYAENIYAFATPA